MNCPNCGAEYAIGYRICPSCNQQLPALDYQAAVACLIDAEGPSILQDAHRFWSSLVDICDGDDPLLCALERNCDDELLSPFVESLTDGQPDSIHVASLRAQYILCHNRGISESKAEGICVGIARPLGDTTPGSTLGEDTTPTNERSDAREWAKTVSQAPTITYIDPHTFANTDSSNNNPHQHANNTGYPNNELQPNVPIGAAVQAKGQRTWKAFIPVALIVALILGIAFTCFSVFTTHSYTLSFDAGGGTGNMSSVTCESNTQTTIPESAFTYEGHEFQAWKDDSGKNYTPGDSIALDKDTRLVATWSEITYAITFDGNGSTGGSMDTMRVSQGEPTLLPNCSYERREYEFECWQDDKGNRYQPGDQVTLSDDLALVAQWRRTSTAEPANGTAPSKITEANLPRSWSGYYIGRSQHAATSEVTRELRITLTQVSATGSLLGECYVGKSNVAAATADCAYEVSGTINWNTGHIQLEGTRWIREGDLLGMGGFTGTVNPDGWEISGEWYDPDGTAPNSEWKMHAS